MMWRNWLILAVIILAVLAIDQGTKRIVIERLALYENVQPVPLLAPFFQITRTENTGAAFGFLPQAGDIFLVIAVIVVAALFYFYPRITTWPTRIGIGLICGGALGNAVDRLFYGPVIDFIHYQIPGVVSNVSNIADHAIVFGVIVVLVDGWRSEAQRQATPAPNTSTQDENSPQ